MQVKALMLGSLMTLLLGISNGVLAQKNIYYPPERINCQLNNFNKFSCDGFNRQYLQEDITNADLRRERQVFFFVSAVAIFTPDKGESSVFYTYNNMHQEHIKLKSINNTIQPDFEAGDWREVSENLYFCDSSYMQCPITSLS